MRAILPCFVLVFAAAAWPRAANAGVEGGLGISGIASLATDTVLTTPGVSRDGSHLGGAGDVRVGWSLAGMRSFGAGLRFQLVPAAAFPENQLQFIPNLYYRETLATSGDLRGATFNVMLGLAPEGFCEGKVCSTHLVPLSAIGFSLPLDLGFGALAATIDLAFRVSTTPGAFGGPRLMPGVGLSYTFPRSGTR